MDKPPIDWNFCLIRKLSWHIILGISCTIPPLSEAFIKEQVCYLQTSISEIS